MEEFFCSSSAVLLRVHGRSVDSNAFFAPQQSRQLREFGAELVVLDEMRSQQSNLSTSFFLNSSYLDYIRSCFIALGGAMAKVLMGGAPMKLTPQPKGT